MCLCVCVVLPGGVWCGNLSDLKNFIYVGWFGSEMKFVSWSDLDCARI